LEIWRFAAVGDLEICSSWRFEDFGEAARLLLINERAKSPNPQITNQQISKSPNPDISKSPDLQISKFRLSGAFQRNS
jgi:hypothetical protein